MTTYHAYSFEYPSKHPFDKLEFRWASFLGEFVRKVTTSHPDILYWSTHYGNEVEFKVFTDDVSFIQSAIDNLKTIGFKVTGLKRTLEQDLGIQRFIGPGSTSNPTRRAHLILKSLKAVCDLMIDSIVQRPDGYWEKEDCGDKSHNPIGNHMFSVTHLYQLIADSDALVFPIFTPDRTLHLLSYYYYHLNKEEIGPHSTLQPQAVKM